ncbi:MAG: type IV pilin N-terminal domain-containing protein [Candidatus Methanoperedens sp.]|nr:type IV pilin N-terminal domain-containing protein [Candidatus Methanoperedens sp.]MCZ7371800.1 type IV pilin N-terminal domain-containing protein [Candidatus Methanoperedens sp.]
MDSPVKNESAVSPISGVLLMVGIALLLSIIVFTISSGLATADEKPPQCSISVQSNAETPVQDIKIQHRGGDTLMAGDWWISIVPAGESPNYQRSSTGFSVGDQIITAILTNGKGNYIVTNNTISIEGSADTMKSGNYEVKIIVYPFESLVFDKVIEVR